MDFVVELEDVVFSYEKKSPLFKVKSLKIKKGDKVFIHGPSGSGKSTLLNILSGILTPSLGKVSVLGHDFTKISESKKDKIRGSHIGYIFQSFNLIPYLTAFENIILPTKASQTRRSNAGDLIDFVEKISIKLGIEGSLDKNVKELSIGQQQRVAVARSLVGSPELIIADEPTSSLDNEVTDEFISLLLDEHSQKGFSLVFVSHDRSLAKHFDHVISLKEIMGDTVC